MKQPLNNSSRIESVDALRGFAVMAIVLVHNLEHFIYPVRPDCRAFPFRALARTPEDVQ